MERWRTRLVPFGWGALGVAVALLLYHFYTDHVALHQIVDFVNQFGPAIQKLPK